MDPLAAICKQLFLAFYFPRPTGIVTVRLLRQKYIVTATVGGILTRRTYPSDPKALALVYASTSTRVFSEGVTYSICRHCQEIGITSTRCTAEECQGFNRRYTRRI